MRTEDGYVIQKCLDGDSAAFGLLVDKYKASVYALAYSKLGNFHDAEDVTQEVFIGAYQKLSTLKRWENFFAWVYSITSNLCKMHFRSKSRRRDSEFLADQGQQTFETLSIRRHREENVSQMLHEALEELPEIYRQVLIFYYLGGMSAKEISAFLGISMTNVNARLSRARALLKEEMITMMSATFEAKRLQPAFTFRVIEAIKRTKIQSAPHKTALPFGASIVAGLIALLLCLTVPYSPLYPIGQLIGSVFPSEMQVTDDGVIPVDAVKVTQIMSLSDQMDNGDFGQKPLPEPVNIFGAGRWERKGDMPTARYIPGSGVIDGKIYVMGGRPFGLLPGKTAANEMYNPNTDAWTTLAPMPTQRQGVSVGVVDGIIYVIGGNTIPADVATVEAYDLVGDRWTRKASMPTRRNMPCTVVVNGKIYAMGGTSNRVEPTVEMYDPAIDKWVKKADMPTPRWGFSTFTVNGKIYAAGGAAIFPPSIALSTIDVYDPLTDTWAEGPDLPTPRVFHSTGVVNGKVYFIGGAGPHPSDALLTVDIYDPATDTWTAGTDLPAPPRSSATIGVVDGKIYYIGGNNDGNLDAPLQIVEEYDPGMEVPSSVNPADKLPTTWGEQKTADAN